MKQGENSHGSAEKKAGELPSLHHAICSSAPQRSPPSLPAPGLTCLFFTSFTIYLQVPDILPTNVLTNQMQHFRETAVIISNFQARLTACWLFHMPSYIAWEALFLMYLFL